MNTDWEDDWSYDYETIEIPDLIRERQIKLLEERKLMEDAELVLTKDLFSEKPQKIVVDEPIKFIKKDKTKELKMLLDNKKRELKEKHNENQEAKVQINNK
jgi:hypothetical protein